MTDIPDPEPTESSSSLGPKLDIVLRKVSWDLDQVAFKLPRRDASKEDLNVLADTLTELIELLRKEDPC